MNDKPDYILDLTSLPAPADNPSPSHPHRDASHTAVGRPWIAIYWRCCHVYSRIYRQPRDTVYQGTCPRCMSRVQATVGPNGTNTRFFYAE